MLKMSLNDSATSRGNTCLISKEDGEEMSELNRNQHCRDDEDEISLSNSANSVVSGSLSGSDCSDDDRNNTNKVEKDRRHGVWVLGNEYDSTRNGEFQMFQASLFWFSYRSSFPELKPYHLTSDAGWGCMLRTSQMLLAHALRKHYTSQDYQPSSITTNDNVVRSRSRRHNRSSYVGDDDEQRADFPNRHSEHDSFTLFVANAFADYPGLCHPFSLPNMVAAGLRYDKLPGEWYGPAAAAHVLKDLIAIHAKQLENKHYDPANNSMERSTMITQQKPLFKTMVVQEGCLFKNKVEELMTEEGLISTFVESSSSVVRKNEQRSKALAMSHPLQESSAVTSPSETDNVPILEWDTALLLIIPLRLGLQKFNTNYSTSVAHSFSLPQSVGIIGGKPRHALWFYGASIDGKHLFGLDPHTVQTTPRRRYNNNTETPIVCDPSYMSSLHCSSYYNPNTTHSSKPLCMSIEKLDPSLALAFYCKDRNDFHRLCDTFSQKQRQLYSLYSVEDKEPDYNTNMSLLAQDGNAYDSDDDLGDSLNSTGKSKRTKQPVEEEDEYVFL